MKRVLSLDPSYTRTGVAVRLNPDDDPGPLSKVYRTPSGTVWGFHSLSIQMYAKGFPFDVQYTLEFMDVFNRFVESFPFDFDVVISEMPPPSGSYSAGLYSLDTALFHEIMTWDAQFFALYPNAINAEIVESATKEERTEIRESSKRGPSKKIIRQVASRLIQPAGINPSWNHDEASAWMLFKIVADRMKDRKPTPKIFQIGRGQSDLLWR